jgi:hypothetical protein
VLIAASGQRRVRLTAMEQRFAAALIVARGDSTYRVGKCLGVNSSAARTLVDVITMDPPELDPVA